MKKVAKKLRNKRESEKTVWGCVKPTLHISASAAHKGWTGKSRRSNHPLMCMWVYVWCVCVCVCVWYRDMLSYLKGKMGQSKSKSGGASTSSSGSGYSQSQEGDVCFDDFVILRAIGKGSFGKVSHSHTCRISRPHPLQPSSRPLCYCGQMNELSLKTNWCRLEWGMSCQWARHPEARDSPLPVAHTDRHAVETGTEGFWLQKS